MSRRILIQLASIPRQIDGKETHSSIPMVFKDWFEFADYIKQENLANRSVTVTKWEYV